MNKRGGTGSEQTQGRVVGVQPHSSKFKIFLKSKEIIYMNYQSESSFTNLR